MNRIYYSLLNLIATVILFLANNSASGQYCSPSFANGCFSWRNQTVLLDAINWTIGSSTCNTSDYTTDTAYLDAGNSYAMSVTSGDWCGCGVWIDLNNDFAFDSTENLFHLYSPNQTNNYNFNISIPASVPTGVYRMRVIAGWGTDCYTVSGNGYGPCGSYQHGNFDDFTVSITSLPTSVTEQENAVKIEASPNPIQDFLSVSIPNVKNVNAQLHLADITGRFIQDFSVTGNKQVLNFSNLPAGIYILNYRDGNNSQTMKIVK